MSDSDKKGKKEDESTEGTSTTTNQQESKNPMVGKEKLANIYNRFVSSFENALNVVAYGEQRSSSSKLSSLTLAGIAEYIKKEEPKHVIVMCGAGISTSAGIPDFRSPGSGLYDNLQKYKLESPQDIFCIDFFDENPEPFFQLAKNLFPKIVKPTPTHLFGRLLEKKGMLQRWYTQNIDTLEFKTGMDDSKIITAHGSHKTSTCRKCHKKYDIAWITEKIERPELIVPKCEKEGCDGVVKPDIVFFGESLPKVFMTSCIKDFPKCDLLIIMGTSLVVQPFAGLIHEVGDDVPRLLINLEPAAEALGNDYSTGLCYNLKGNRRDVFHQGKCDDGVRALCELLDWEHELDELIAESAVKHSSKAM